MPKFIAKIWYLLLFTRLFTLGLDRKPDDGWRDHERNDRPHRRLPLVYFEGPSQSTPCAHSLFFPIVSYGQVIPSA